MRLEIAGLFIMYWLTVVFADRIKSRRRG
jgi:hypothetical protein